VKSALPIGDLSTANGSDVIVVGSGVAGLRAAIEAASRGARVALLAKDSTHDSSTDRAQGGVAVALSDEDEIGLHYRDTLAAGDGLCDEEAVALLVSEGPLCIAQLIEWGAAFDREGSRLAFTREAAHSARRILHAQGDATGREILRTLWSRAAALEGLTFLPHTYSVDLLIDGACRGLLVMDESTGAVRPLRGGAVVLATGGLGQVYQDTTNPVQATGDGIAVALRAGAVLRDMEFVQFHPTSLHLEGAPRFLLSEALRGEGGLLRSLDGRRFVSEHDPRGELAPRDIVARAITAEMQRTGSDHVLLDMTHLDPDFLRRRFPGIVATCQRYGVDLTANPAPVAPAAHYAMGGVATDLWGRTAVRGLLAAGEVACTGVHGANRLASNSLLEGLVYGARAGSAALEPAVAPDLPEAARACLTLSLPVSAAESCGAPILTDPAAAATLVRSVASGRLGIVRDGEGLASAVRCLEDLMAAAPGGPAKVASLTRPAMESLSLVTAALAIARSALARAESRGAHYRSDAPDHDDARYGRSSCFSAGMDRAAIADAPGGIPQDARTATRRD